MTFTTRDKKQVTDGDRVYIRSGGTQIACVVQGRAARWRKRWYRISDCSSTPEAALRGWQKDEKTKERRGR